MILGIRKAKIKLQDMGNFLSMVTIYNQNHSIEYLN